MPLYTQNSAHNSYSVKLRDDFVHKKSAHNSYSVKIRDDFANTDLYKQLK